MNRRSARASTPAVMRPPIAKFFEPLASADVW
jgi:hypothetical protein